MDAVEATRAEAEAGEAVSEVVVAAAEVSEEEEVVVVVEGSG